MNMEELRAKAEAAKAWFPTVVCGCADEADVVGAGGTDCRIFNCEEDDCDACLGAQLAVDDIESKIDNAMACIATSTKLREVSRWVIKAARIASYFAAVPNPVSEFRDAVKEMCK